mgnify:CR=1 FL=1
MKITVIIQFEIEGFHQYPNAPQEVNFLSDRHRHTFKVKAGYSVKDLNREKEIFIERDYIKEYLSESYGSPCEFGPMSCEMIEKKYLLLHKKMEWYGVKFGKKIRVVQE